MKDKNDGVNERLQKNLGKHNHWGKRKKKESFSRKVRKDERKKNKKIASEA